MAKKKRGRPKMPKNQRKVGFSIKVKPELWKQIEALENRNSKIEAILERDFNLQSIHAWKKQMEYWDKFKTEQLQEIYERRKGRKSYHMSREGFIHSLSFGLKDIDRYTRSGIKGLRV